MKIIYKYFNVNPETKLNQKTYKSNQYMNTTAKWFVMQFSKTENNSWSSCEQNKSSFHTFACGNRRCKVQSQLKPLAYM